jgi:hypothetical protein
LDSHSTGSRKESGRYSTCSRWQSRANRVGLKAGRRESAGSTQGRATQIAENGPIALLMSSRCPPSLDGVGPLRENRPLTLRSERTLRIRESLRENIPERMCLESPFRLLQK